MRIACLIFACWILVGCSQTGPEPASAPISPEHSHQPTGFDPYDSSRGTRTAPLLQPSPAGDLKFWRAKSASKSPADPPPESSSPEAIPPATNVRALIERWSQPDEPLTLVQIAAGQLGKRASHLEFTADGKLLYVAIHKDARHLLFQTADGKKVLDVLYGDAPLQSSNISPDGKYLLATRGDKGVGVWEIASQQEIFLHERLVDATSVLATRADPPMIASAHSDGSVRFYPLLGGKGRKWNWRAKDSVPANIIAPLSLAAAADGQTLCIFDRFTPGNLHLAFADGRFCSVHVSTSNGGPVAAGTNVFADTLTPGEFRLTNPAPDHMSVSTRNPKITSWGARILSVAPDDRFAAYIGFDKQLLDIVSCRTDVRKSRYFPPGNRGYLGAVNWPTGTIATADVESGINLFRFSHHTSAADLLVQEVDRCLAEKDDERLEQLAAELEQHTTNFPFDGIDDTKYRRLIQTLMGSFAGGADRAGHYQDWLERNPDSKLTRICRATRLISEGWSARGEGSAASVSPEGWRIFDEKTKEAGEILESLAQADSIPGEGYALIFGVAKAQDWPKEKTEPYVERLFQESLHDVRAHGRRIHGLLPRWGGAPGECRKYAERVAAAIGGADGDAMYAALVVSLMNMADHGIVDQLGFDPVRFQKGLDHRFRNDPDNPQYWQLAVILASIAGDEKRQHEFALKIAMRNDPYAGLYCSEPIFHDLIQSAQRFNPGR